jgi:hypothetical protein
METIIRELKNILSSTSAKYVSANYPNPVNQFFDDVMHNAAFLSIMEHL